MNILDLEEGEHELTSEEKLAAWGNGEWVEEADHINFEYKGYKCLVKRVYSKYDYIIELGHLCGYMVVPQEHPWHSKPWDEIDCNVHGGLTFGKRSAHNYYLIGFDCCHGCDVSPGLEAFKHKQSEIMKSIMGYEKSLPKMCEMTYKNMAFVIGELKSLVDQAIEAQSL